MNANLQFDINEFLKNLHLEIEETNKKVNNKLIKTYNNKLYYDIDIDIDYKNYNNDEINDANNLVEITLSKLDTSIINFDYISNEDIKKYLKTILYDRFTYIIGMHLGCISDLCYISLYCDYCGTNIDECRIQYLNKFAAPNYYFCFDCQIDMCYWCYTEGKADIESKINTEAKVDVEIKVNIKESLFNLLKEHNSTEEKYNTRRDKIINCLENDHNIIKRSNYCDYIPCECDFCKDLIYTDKYTNIHFTELDNCKDLCLKCAETEKGKEFIKEHKLEFRKLNLLYDNTGFGSIFDYIPYKIDNECNVILINCNPNSEYFKRIAIYMCDDHGRSGMYHLSNLTVDDIDYINERLEHFQKELVKIAKNSKRGLDEFENMPIKRLADQYNILTHY